MGLLKGAGARASSSIDEPEADAEECPSLGGPATDPGPIDAPKGETETLSDARHDAPAGALLGALGALAVVALARRK